jgi:hypothetical protein
MRLEYNQSYYPVNNFGYLTENNLSCNFSL